MLLNQFILSSELNSMATRVFNFPFTDAQKAELDQRLIEHQDNPDSGCSLEQITQKLGVKI